MNIHEGAVGVNYLILRGELIEKCDKIKIVDQLKKIGEWTYDETDWPEFMVGKFPYTVFRLTCSLLPTYCCTCKHV